MALTSETGVFVVSVSDSILSKGYEVIQNFAAPTNQYDKDINLMICLTVLGVCFFICVTVFACFIAVSRIKRHSKKKEYELEIQKLDKNEKIWKLQYQYHKDKLDQDYKVRKALLEVENQKAIQDFEIKKEVWEQNKDRKVWEVDTELAVANAIRKTQVEWLESICNSQQSDSKEKNKEKSNGKKEF